MHPILFTIPDAVPLLGGLSIYTYGVLTATGYLVGITWILHEARVKGIDRALVADGAFWAIVGALVGGRVLYIITEYDRYLKEPLAILKVWEGGLVFYGGFIGVIFVGLWYARKAGITFFRIADLFAVGLPLGHAIGRLGCLMAGCCYGRPVAGDPWWALHFSHHPKSMAPPGIPLYPSQLLEAGTLLLIFVTLILIRRRQKFDGQILISYIIIYGIARSILELARGDAVRGYVIPGWLSTSQFISIILIVLAVIYYIRQWRQNEARDMKHENI